MKRFLIGLLALGLTTQIYAQIVDEESLPEITIRAVNYKYLDLVDNSEAGVPVQLLEDKAANFDLKNSEFYEDGSEIYKVFFYIPKGRIVAAYDRQGEILYTIERFENVALPYDVAASIKERFPGWKMAKDVYRVNYDVVYGAKKQYKVVLKNGKKTIRVKIDDEGEFL